MKAIKTVVLSAVRWTNEEQGLRRGLRKLLTSLGNTKGGRDYIPIRIRIGM